MIRTVAVLHYKPEIRLRWLTVNHLPMSRYRLLETHLQLPKRKSLDTPRLVQLVVIFAEFH